MANTSEEPRRYYVRNEVVEFEEDATHEFKGHRNLCSEEIPPWTIMPDTEKRTRAPVSRVLNGFLNSAVGGTAYLGIIDCGVVKGLNLTLYQQDHILASLTDLMSRYSPPVESHRYSIHFVPVIEAAEAEKYSTEVLLQRIEDRDSSKRDDPSLRLRDHLLRTHAFCWCIKESIGKYNCGIMAQDYVVEIVINPWDPEHPDNKYAVGEMKAPPVHEDECRKVYFRRQATVLCYTVKEIYEISKQRVQIHYQSKLKRLREELETLRAEST